MKFTLWAGLSLLVIGSLAVGCRASPDAVVGLPHHYFDPGGAPLPQHDAVWQQLATRFRTSVPDTIVVRRGTGETSRFSPLESEIILAPGQESTRTIAHESTHLALFRLTNGASATAPFRFIDEGLASIVEHRTGGDGEAYKAYALAVAREEMQRGNVSFARVQDWSRYFGASTSSPRTRNWRAYQVGSSFVYMIEDAKGAAALDALLADLGTTRDLNNTCQNVFGSPAHVMEQAWLDYLARVQVDPTVPSIVSMSPADQTSVTTDVRELVVRFSVPMGPNICVLTPCGDTGVCYTNARWRDTETLVVPVRGRLEPGRAYVLSLGNPRPGGCRLRSLSGVDMPVTPWRFDVASRASLAGAPP